MAGVLNTGLAEVLQRALAEAAPGSRIAASLEDTPVSAEITGRVLERRGPGLLLSAGLLFRAPETPALTCLRRNPDPVVIAEKFMRLEGYCHARHRTRITAGPEGEWQCTRESQGPASGLGENCLAAGQLMALLKDTGYGNLSLAIGGRRIAARDLPGAGFQPGETGARFTIAWTARDLPDPVPEPESPALSGHLAALLDTDIGRSWRIGVCARVLGLQVRSLQRYLAAEGRSFSPILRQARMKAATRLLADPGITLAETGYCCGYADQAHFQRDFRRALKMTPKRFRETGAALQ